MLVCGCDTGSSVCEDLPFPGVKVGHEVEQASRQEQGAVRARLGGVETTPRLRVGGGDNRATCCLHASGGAPPLSNLVKE